MHQLPTCIRAGHATILSRQRDHVFRPQSCYVLPYYNICLATPSKHRDLNIFRIFLVPEALLRCRVVVVKKLKNCRVPSSVKTYAEFYEADGESCAVV